MAGELVLGSDEWMADFLLKGLAASYEGLAKAKSYRDGTNALVDLGIGSTVESYAQFVQMSRLNFAEQISDAVISKCRFTGFRTAGTDDEDGDEVAGRVASVNRLSSQYPVMADSKATYGRGYMTVLEPTPEDGPEALPTIVVTDAWRTFSMEDPIRPWVTKAAVTIGWNPETNTDTVMLFRAGAKPGDAGYLRVVSRFDEGGRSMFPAPSVDTTSFSVNLADPAWVWGPVQKFQKIVGSGVVKFSTRDGFGLFQKHYDSLDRVNLDILNRIIIMVLQAFKQRAIENGASMDSVYPEGHPRAGQAVDFNELFKTGPDSMWLLPEHARMWESGVVPIEPLIEAEKSDLRHLASVTGTPLYVLDPSAANGSASGADLSRETHISKVTAWRDQDGDAMRQVMSFALQAMGEDDRAAIEEIEVMWLDMSIVTPEAKGSAAKMLRDAGFSKQYIGEKVMGMDPKELRRERDSAQVEGFASSFGATPSATGSAASGMPPRVGGALAGGR